MVIIIYGIISLHGIQNVVKAGQGSPAKFIEKENKYVPYHRLFDNTESINIDEIGEFDVPK